MMTLKKRKKESSKWKQKEIKNNNQKYYKTIKSPSKNSSSCQLLVHDRIWREFSLKKINIGNCHAIVECVNYLLWQFEDFLWFLIETMNFLKCDFIVNKQILKSRDFEINLLLFLTFLNDKRDALVKIKRLTQIPNSSTRVDSAVVSFSQKWYKGKLKRNAQKNRNSDFRKRSLWECFLGEFFFKELVLPQDKNCM